jgi:predicted RNA-binding Zn-ribbon protein involved in translation (DUF1610 family)
LAKTKSKTHSEIENSRGIIRELEKEIRSLRQQLRQFEKYERSQESDQCRDSEDTIVELKMKNPCPDCGKGEIVQTMEIAGKVYGTCNHCGYNGRMK